MITPDKYLDLKHSVINVSAAIIQVLRRINVLQYDELKAEVCIAIGEEASHVFPYSLNFLFLLDKIEYNPSMLSFTLKK